MSIENITSAQAERLFVDDLAARRYEDEVLYAGPSTVTEDERAAIRRVLDEKCRPECGMTERLDAFVRERMSRFFSAGGGEWRLAASTGKAGEGKKEHADIRFVFVSAAGTPKELSWRAVLDIPGAAEGSEMLKLKVSGVDGSSAGNGLFTVAGTTLLVENGVAELQMDVFLVGIRNSSVFFQREGCDTPVSGNLMFF